MGISGAYGLAFLIIKQNLPVFKVTHLLSGWFLRTILFFFRVYVFSRSEIGMLYNQIRAAENANYFTPVLGWAWDNNNFIRWLTSCRSRNLRLGPTRWRHSPTAKYSKIRLFIEGEGTQHPRRATAEGHRAKYSTCARELDEYVRLYQRAKRPIHFLFKSPFNIRCSHSRGFDFGRDRT